MQLHTELQKIRLTVLSNDRVYLRCLEDNLGTLSDILITVLQDAELFDAGATDTDADALLFDADSKSHTDIKNVIKKLSASLPHVKIVLVSDGVDDELLAQSIRHNVCGILSKEFSSSVYLKALTVILSGEIWLGRKMLASLLNYLAGEQNWNARTNPSGMDKALTIREQEIVGLVARGLSNKEVARMIELSPVTVKTHLQHIFEKLHINRRAELILQSDKFHRR